MLLFPLKNSPTPKRYSVSYHKKVKETQQMSTIEKLKLVNFSHFWLKNLKQDIFLIVTNSLLDN